MDHGVTTRRRTAKPGTKSVLLGACFLLLLSACGRSSDDAGAVETSVTITTLPLETVPKAVTTTAATTTSTTTRPLEYIIQPGDSLSRIAERFGLSTDDLANFNSISDVNSIQVKQVLRIPPVTVAPATTAVEETTTTAAG